VNKNVLPLLYINWKKIETQLHAKQEEKRKNGKKTKYRMAELCEL
jgi:hypothetical protein